jgi:hypothetical protein
VGLIRRLVRVFRAGRSSDRPDSADRLPA